MSQTRQKLVRPGFLLSLFIGFGFLYVVANLLLPQISGSRKAKLPSIIANLKLIDVAKEMWASDHKATNGTPLSEQDLLEYVRPPVDSTGLVRSVDSEVYTHNPIGTPSQAKLENPIGTRFPKGTLIRCSTNRGPEILLPNTDGKANGWQPL